MSILNLCSNFEAKQGSHRPFLSIFRRNFKHVYTTWQCVCPNSILQNVGFEQWLFTLTTGFWWRTYPRVAVFICVTFNWKFRSNFFSFTLHNADPSELCGKCQHSKLTLVYSSDWIKTYHIYLHFHRTLLWVIFLSSRCFHCIRLKYQIMSTAN